MMAFAVTLALVLFVATVVAVMTIKSLIVIVPPNTVAVLTGSKQSLPSGETVGYRTVIGGRTLRVPLIETVQYMVLEPFPIGFSVPNTITKSNVPLTIEATANVKIASEPPSVLRNAVERLLGRTEEETLVLAKNTLTGAVRGFVATLLSEEATRDPHGFATALRGDASKALAAQGFHLDSLEIERVSEEPDYRGAE